MASPFPQHPEAPLNRRAQSHGVAQVQFEILGQSITCGVPEPLESLERIYPGATRTSGSAPHRAAVHQPVASTGPGNQESLPDILGRIEYLIDTAAATTLSSYLRIHAGAVADGASGIIMPAPSGGGKSTLVAALCLSGFRYVSDEFALFDPQVSRLFPYPKSIGLKEPGRVLVSRAFNVESGWTSLRRVDGQRLHYLTAPAPLPPGESVRISYIIVPRWSATGRATLAEMPRADALMSLLRQTLNLPLHGAAGLEAIVQMVEQAQCFTLSYASLPDAVEQLSQLTRRA